MRGAGGACARAPAAHLAQTGDDEAHDDALHEHAAEAEARQDVTDLRARGRRRGEVPARARRVRAACACAGP